MMVRNQIDYSRRDMLKKGAITAGALVLGGTAASGTVAAGTGDGRVGHYNLNNLHMNRDTGAKIKNFVHDASPAKNHGTNSGAEVVKDGPVGNAFGFEGDNTVSPRTGDWVDVNQTLLDGATSGTVAGWFKADTVDTAGGVFGHRLGLDTERGGLTFRVLDADFSNFSDGSIELIVNGWEGQNIEVPLDSDDGTWHHISGVYDGNVAEVYVDGDKRSTADYSEPLAPYDHFEIGRYKWEDNGGEWYFDGLVDEVRVYNRALSPAEITELYEMRD